MRTDREIKAQIVAVRERLKELSGFWIGEGAAVIYALEWVLGKRDPAPAAEIGKTGGEHERIAANLTKLVEKAAASRPARPRPVPGGGRKARKKSQAAS